MHLDTNNKILSANSATLNSGSKLYVGSGTFNTAIVAAGSGLGSVYFADDNALSGDIGSAALSLNHVEFAEATTVFVNNHMISASNIVIGGGASLRDVANLVGAVLSSGTIYLNSSSSNTATADFTATIDDGGYHASMVAIYDQDVTAGANIGAIHRVGFVTLFDNAILRLNEGVAKSISADNIWLSLGSKIYLGSATINGDIMPIINANNIGSVYLTANNTLAGNIGESESALNRVEISPSVTIAAGTKNIEALNIVLGANSTLNTSAIVSGITSLSLGAVINFLDGSAVGRSSSPGAIYGASNGAGNINTKSGSETIYSAIGIADHNLAAFNVESASQATLQSDIAATNITVSGQLNLAKEAENNLSGNVVGNSRGETNLNAFSHAITGNLTLNSGAILAADISNSTNAGNIVVSGAAAIEKNAILKLSLLGPMALGSHYTLVVGGSGSSLNKISDSNITIDNGATNHVGIFSFSTVIIGNNLVVEVDRYKIPELTNSNHSSFYNAIAENYDASGSLLTLQQYLDSGSSNRIVFDNVNKAIDLVSNRISALNGGDLSSPSGLASGDDDLKNPPGLRLLTQMRIRETPLGLMDMALILTE